MKGWRTTLLNQMSAYAQTQQCWLLNFSHIYSVLQLRGDKGNQCSMQIYHSDKVLWSLFSALIALWCRGQTFSSTALSNTLTVSLSEPCILLPPFVPVGLKHSLPVLTPNNYSHSNISLNEPFSLRVGLTPWMQGTLHTYIISRMNRSLP